MSALLLLAASCTKESPADEPKAEQPEIQVDAYKAPTFLNVLLDDELTSLVEDQLASGILRTKSDALNSVTEDLGVVSMERLFPFAGEYEPRTRREGLHKWYRVELPSEELATTATKAFGALPGVEYVEEQAPAKLDTNDPYWSSNLWGLNNTRYSGFDVNCAKVWQEFTVGNPKVVVAVLDGGIDLSHPDLAWNCLESGHYNYVERNTEITGDNHGTHVAGTIAAVSNNGTGVAGIAGGDYAAGKHGVSLLSLQCFQTYTVNGKDVTRSGSFETAMKEAADKGANISQNSWGYDYDSDEDGKISNDELAHAKSIAENIGRSAIAASMNYFVKYAGCDNDGNQLKDSPMKGGLVVFAAGNDNIYYGAPANYEAAVAVGAMTQSGKKASFSNYGDWVDVCAPGYQINSTVPNGKYAALSGTSMACPHVSGVAALILSYFGGQGFTADDLRKRLEEGARDIGLSEGDSPIGPLVDAYGSFMSGSSEVPDPVADFTLTPLGHNVRMNFSAVDAYGYLILAAPSEQTVKNASLTNPEGSGLITGNFITANPEERTGTKEFLFTELVPDRDYYVAIASYSYDRRFSELSAIRKVHTNVNAVPTVQTAYDGNFTFRNFQTVDIPFEISDPDGDILKVDFQTDGRATFTQEDDGLWHFRLSCQLVRAPASFSASLVVTDDFGGKYSNRFNYSILKNAEPAVTADLPNVLLSKQGDRKTIELNDYITDEDGEELDFRITVADNTAVSTELLDGHLLRITAVSSVLSLTEVRVLAYDALGASAKADIRCIVRPEGESISLLEGRVISDRLTILSGEEPEKLSIRLVSSNGTVVFRTEGEFSAFNPLEIDTRYLAPGVYTLFVTDSSGKETRYSIVKR